MIRKKMQNFYTIYFPLNIYPVLVQEIERVTRVIKIKIPYILKTAGKKRGKEKK